MIVHQYVMSVESVLRPTQNSWIIVRENIPPINTDAMHYWLKTICVHFVRLDHIRPGLNSCHMSEDICKRFHTPRSRCLPCSRTTKKSTKVQTTALKTLNQLKQRIPRNPNLMKAPVPYKVSPVVPKPPRPILWTACTVEEHLSAEFIRIRISYRLPAFECQAAVVIAESFPN